MIDPKGRHKMPMLMATTLGAEAAARLGQLVLVALVARALGTSMFGIVVLGWSVTAIFAPIGQIAPETVGVRLIASGQPLVTALRQITQFKLAAAISALGAALGLGAIIWAFGTSTDTTLLTQVLLNMCVLVLIAVQPGWALRGLLQNPEANLARIAQTAITLLACYLLVGFWAHPALVALGELAGATIGAVIGSIFLYRATALAPWHYLGIGYEPGAVAGTRDRDAIFINALAATAATAIWYVPLWIAPLFLSLDSFGTLSAVWRLIIALYAVGLVVYQILHPIMVRAYTDDLAKGRLLSAQLILLALVLSAVGASLVAAFSPVIADILFGPKFADAAPLLAFLSPILVPAMVASVPTYALLSGGADKDYALASVITLGLSAGASALVFMISPDPRAMIILAAILILHGLLQAHFARRRGLFAWGDLARALRAPFALSGR
jgi:O-antigen/teichoic acid export membrane protein